jgi:hypothetical protein
MGLVAINIEPHDQRVEWHGRQPATRRPKGACAGGAGFAGTQSGKDFINASHPGRAGAPVLQMGQSVKTWGEFSSSSRLDDFTHVLRKGACRRGAVPCLRIPVFCGAGRTARQAMGA